MEFSGPERTSRYTSGTVGPSANDESPRSDRAIRAALVSREGAAALFEEAIATLGRGLGPTHRDRL